MAAAIAAAGITAGTSLVSGLLTAKANAEEQRRNRILQAIQEEARQKQQIQSTLAAQSQTALGQGLQGFTAALR